MIKRFHKVVDGLYRGSAPSTKDVINLYKYCGIRKIISLDAAAGEHINKVCRLLGIKHITIPINALQLEPLIKLLSEDLYDLLIKDGPTYVHCIEGKDRTGMVIAMFKCKYLHISANEAIKEAEGLGFGIGVPENILKVYKEIIRQSCKNKEDVNDADIVDNARHHGDFMDGVLDSATMQSWAPYMSAVKEYPYTPDYNYWDDQYPTRNNHDLKFENTNKEKEDQVPSVGLYDAPAMGFGPVDKGGGFMNN